MPAGMTSLRVPCYHRRARRLGKRRPGTEREGEPQAKANAAIAVDAIEHVDAPGLRDRILARDGKAEPRSLDLAVDGSLARIERVEHTLAPVPLAEIVRRVLREQKLAAVARMIDFETSLAPLVVVGDHEKIRTVIDNLLSNAIKYSPRKGAVEIAVTEQDGFAVLDVADHGPGIAPEERERVFDSFYSGKAPVDGKVKGSGLGLAIAREYAIAQSGRIEVLDRGDGQRGVRFRVWLPLSIGVRAPLPEIPRSPVHAGTVK